MNQLRARLELKKGNESYLAGKYDAAIAHYDRVLWLLPRSPQAYLNRAYSQVALFRLSPDADEKRRLAGRAIDSFRQYLKLAAGRGGKTDGPGRGRVEEHILTLYIDSGQVDSATAFLESRLAGNPRDLPAIQMLSNIAADHGDLDGALKWLRRRIEIEPEKPESHYALGVFAWRVSYYNMTADSLLRARILDEGRREMERAIQLNPGYFEAHSYLNLLYRQMAQHAADDAERIRFEALARQHRERALRLRPGGPEGTTPRNATEVDTSNG